MVMDSWVWTFQKSVFRFCATSALDIRCTDPPMAEIPFVNFLGVVLFYLLV